MKRLFREQVPKDLKKFDAIVLKSMDTEVSETEEERVLKFIISNEAEDSYKDVVSSDGWDLKRFKSNPVVLWAHDHRQPPVGKAVSIGVEGDNLVAEAKFADAETYEFADTVFKLLQGGFLKATSVGFFPKEWTYDEERGGYNLLQNELFEFSIVPVPANPEALQLAVDSGIDIAPLKSWAEEILTAPEGDQDPSEVLKGIDVPGILRSIEAVEEAATDRDEDGYDEHRELTPVEAAAATDDEITEEDVKKFEKFIDDLPQTVTALTDSVESLKAQLDQLVARMDQQEADAEARAEEDAFDLSAVIDLQPIDTTDVDEVSRSIIDLEIDPEELQGCIRKQLEENFMRTTGKLPKEV